MATSYQHLTNVADWAYAPDRGSLWVYLDGPGGGAEFTLVRSFASQGEGNFNNVLSKDGTVLSNADVAALCEKLKTLASSLEDGGQFVESFLSALRIV